MSAPEPGAPGSSNAPLGAIHWPVEVRLKRAEKILEVAFDNGVRFRYPAELLRVESPSAEVQGHGPSQKQLVTGRAHVGILELEPVGNYAIRIVFDDKHDTGIYSWSYLRELGDTYEEKWAAYQAALKTLTSTVDGVERRVVPAPDWGVTTRIDTSAVWPTVWRAVQCHRTQMSIYKNLAGLPPEHHRALWGVQEFYRVFSLVSGGRTQETDLFEGLR